MLNDSQMAGLNLLKPMDFYKPGAQEQERLNRLTSLFSYASSIRVSHEARWKRNYEYYYNIDRELLARSQHQSKYFVPRSYLVVNIKTARMVQTLLAKDPLFSVAPCGSDDELKARVSSELISQQLKNQDNIYAELVTWFKDSFIYGSGIAKDGWEYRQSIVPKRIVGTPTLDMASSSILIPDQTQWNVMVEKDSPYLKNIDVGQLYPDPHADKIEDCNFIIERCLVPRTQLMALAQLGLYQNVEYIPTNAATNSEVSDFTNRIYSTGTFNKPYSWEDPIYSHVELLECWWRDEYNNKYKTVIANRSVIIQDIQMPYWHMKFPYHLLKADPMTGQFWGWGEIDAIVDLQRELNELRNQQADNRNQMLKSFWIVDKSAGVDLEELEDMPPGGILEVSGDPGRALRIHTPPSMDNFTFPAMQQVDSDIQMVSGVSDLAIGMPTRSQIRTATTGQILAQSMDIRFGLTALLYLEQLRKVGKHWLAMNQQFMTQPKMVRVVGIEGLMQDLYVTPNDIPDQYDVYVTTGSEYQGNQDIIRQQKIQLFSLLSQVPGFNLTEYSKEMLRVFNEKNPERYFEGTAVVPTSEILKEMGVADSQVVSSYKEQVGGMIGGGTQGSGNQVSGASSMADVLQMKGRQGVA